MRQLANHLLQPLATTAGDILVLYIMLESPFCPLHLFIFLSLDIITALHLLLKLYSDFRSCLLCFPSFHPGLQLSELIGERMTRNSLSLISVLHRSRVLSLFTKVDCKAACNMIDLSIYRQDYQMIWMQFECSRWSFYVGDI